MTPYAWCTWCFGCPSRRLRGVDCRGRCRVWLNWFLAGPARCGAPEALLSPHEAACDGRGAAGWVAASWLLFPCRCFRLVSACFVLLTLLLFYSVFRVLAVCYCASCCAAGGGDMLRSCHACFSKRNLLDVNNTHTRRTFWSHSTTRADCAAS